MSPVTIVGAGIAGLTAALRLVERGFDVTILDQNDFLGGKLGAHNHGARKDDYHEHSFHMYLNWYRNFWQIAEEVGIRDQFVPQPTIPHLRRDDYREAVHLTNLGSVEHFWQNIFCGLAPPLDMFLYGCSLMELLGTDEAKQHVLDETSLLAFMNRRGYTGSIMKMHDMVLAKAFACPTNLADVRCYRRFINFGFREPAPMMWLLKGNTQQYLFARLESHLWTVVREKQREGSKSALRICLLNRVDKIYLQMGKICSLRVAELTASPVIDQERSASVRAIRQEPIHGDVIFAIPPNDLSRLIDAEICCAAPRLASIRRLHSQSMASFDVYFKTKLQNIPKGIVVLLDSAYDLSFVDNSQLWPRNCREDVTFLNAVISDYGVACKKRAPDDLEQTKEDLLTELRHYIAFNYNPRRRDDDVDRERCHFHIGQPLFLNEIGSWEDRPETTCVIPNLFIAGDYSRTFVDVVTIEAAVVSGLLAADAVRQRAGAGNPVKIIQPATYPQTALTALWMMNMPFAYAAKAWSALSNASIEGRGA